MNKRNDFCVVSAYFDPLSEKRNYSLTCRCFIQWRFKRLRAFHVLPCRFPTVYLGSYTRLYLYTLDTRDVFARDIRRVDKNLCLHKRGSFTVRKLRYGCRTAEIYKNQTITHGTLSKPREIFRPNFQGGSEFHT